MSSSNSIEMQFPLTDTSVAGIPSRTSSLDLPPNDNGADHTSASTSPFPCYPVNHSSFAPGVPSSNVSVNGLHCRLMLHSVTDALAMGIQALAVNNVESRAGVLSPPQIPASDTSLVSELLIYYMLPADVLEG